jgi:probable HAF family extracellular repeat protein
MYRKIGFVLLALSASLLCAQDVPRTNGSIRTKLRGINDDGVVLAQKAPAQAGSQGNPAFGQPQPEYTFTSFQFPGVSNTNAFGINNEGQIVGGYRIRPGPSHALLIDQGQFIPLAPSSVLGNHFSAAFDINERGDVVGTYRDDQGSQHGFLLSNNVLTNIDFPGGTATDAFGINASGTIVGDFSDSAGAFHGFVLHDGIFTQINVPGAVDTEATKINAAGDIVGSWDTDINTTGHGFVLTREGQFIIIDAPKAVPEGTSAFGINDRGEIVGGYVDSIGDLHCFLLVAGTFTDVDFPGAPFTQCVGINDRASIAGGFFPGNGTGATAYVATPTHP